MSINLILPNYKIKFTKIIFLNHLKKVMDKSKKIIFVASYPKSGNTWLRSIISSLVYNPEGRFTFNDLKKVSLFSQFSNFKNLDNHQYHTDGNLNYNWISDNWIKAQKKINTTKNEVVFFKTHSVRGVVNKNFFTDESVCLGFVYIIRDPRDVVVSLSKHMGIDINMALKEMLSNTRRMTSFNKVNELVSTWKNNVDSWMQFRNVPRLVLKYEDMINDINTSILQIAEFLNNIGNLNLKMNNDLLKSIKISTSFKKLQLLEKNQKFDEATPHSRFFRKGTSGGWKKILTNQQTKQIEDRLSIPMKHLSYL